MRVSACSSKAHQLVLTLTAMYSHISMSSNSLISSCPGKYRVSTCLQYTVLHTYRIHSTAAAYQMGVRQLQQHSKDEPAILILIMIVPNNYSEATPSK